MTLDISALVAGVVGKDLAALGRAVTLVESTRPQDEVLAAELLEALEPRTGAALRVGVTGVPGAGKSTLLDALGMHALGLGRTVAVLAVDPTSARGGGSILGDKTRMARLSRDPRAFIRPSPSGGELGGVAHATREAIRVVEAAGFDTVLVETVGVGQSETTVASMVDTFVWMVIPNAGDELQGIKRGIAELADVVVVNKADGDRLQAAARAAVEVESALRYLSPATEGWTTPVLTVSALEGRGMDTLLGAMVAHRAHLAATGALAERRTAQELAATWRVVETSLVARARARSAADVAIRSIEADVRAGRLGARVAASRILAALKDA